jgi:hypothetical protein
MRRQAPRPGLALRGVTAGGRAARFGRGRATEAGAVTSGESARVGPGARRGIALPEEWWVDRDSEPRFQGVANVAMVLANPLEVFEFLSVFRRGRVCSSAFASPLGNLRSGTVLEQEDASRREGRCQSVGAVDWPCGPRPRWYRADPATTRGRGRHGSGSRRGARGAAEGLSPLDRRGPRALAGLDQGSLPARRVRGADRVGSRQGGLAHSSRRPASSRGSPTTNAKRAATSGRPTSAASTPRRGLRCGSGRGRSRTWLPTQSAPRPIAVAAPSSTAPRASC